jgi:lysophospholipase L1-like esterase
VPSNTNFNNGQYDVMIIGDSHALNWKLEEISGMKCVNLGAHGETTQQLAYRASHQFINSPKFLIIITGANDARCVLSFPQSKDRIVDKAFSNIQEIIQRFDDKCEIIVLTIPPVFKLPLKYHLFSVDESKRALEELNSKIRKIKIDNVTILDANTILSRIGKDLSTDGIHLNKKAYEILEAHLKQHINSN